MEIKTKLLATLFFIVSFEAFSQVYMNSVKLINAKWGSAEGEVYVDYSGDMGIEGIDFPSEFIFDSLYNVFVLDLHNQKVLKFSKEGKFKYEIHIDSAKALLKTIDRSNEKGETYRILRHIDEGYFYIKDSLNSSLVKFKPDKDSLIYCQPIGIDVHLNNYVKHYKGSIDTLSIKRKKEILNLKKDNSIEVLWKIKKYTLRERENVWIMDRWGNSLEKIIGPLTTIKTTIKEGYGPPIIEDKLIELYKQIKIDPYGNIYIQGLKPSEYFIFKYPKIHYKPVVVSKMPAKRIPGNAYNVAEYTSAPQGKIKESGFKLLKDGKEIYKLETSGLSTVKYLGKDKLGQYWVYYESPRKKKVDKKYIVDGNNKDWFIMKKERGRFFKKGIWYTVLCSINLRMLSKSIPGIINENMIDFDKVKVGSDGNLYYKDKGKWYRQENIQQMDFTATDVQSFAGIEKDIKVEPYTNYEDVAPIELERGIEIKKGNESIRKFKYYSQDTLYTVKNLGLDDKNNIYVYVNWFDWLTKDKMKEVVKFNTKGEFQNRINLTKEETPVLGLDGFVYTHENEGAEGIVRKYEGKTLP